MSPKEGSADNAQEEITPFADLMALQHLEKSTRVLGAPTDKPEVVETFQSVSLPFSPGAGQRAFGGHVFAQSAYAASKTVKKGFVIHVSFNLAILNIENLQSQCLLPSRIR